MKCYCYAYFAVHVLDLGSANKTSMERSPFLLLVVAEKYSEMEQEDFIDISKYS